METINLPKHVHVIGICGVAMSALAIAFHKRGIMVTGSDKGFFPPVSTELEKQSLPFYAGWHPEKMLERGNPDLIIIGTASGSQNPETTKAKELSIPMYSYPEIIGKFFAKENSLVCAGTWGKTSSSALLSFIMENAGFDPSYMFGGVSLSHDQSAKLTDSKWSVFEGDEYKSSPTDKRAKFFHYKPTHLLLTAVSWDHADLYPSEKEYFEAFDKLLNILPSQGLIIACRDNIGVTTIIRSYRGKVVGYGIMPANKHGINDSDYYYDKVKQSKHGIDFTIHCGNESWNITSPMLGSYQAENITGCFAMAREIGIPQEKIIQAIHEFRGLKRRLEKRLDGNNTNKGITILDDIAHSPEKAHSVLKTLRDIYQGKIFAIFEPNSGGRERNAVSKYDNAFDCADIVIIPRLTKLKISEDADPDERPIEGNELVQIINKYHINVHYIDDDKEVTQYLRDNTKNGDTIVFMGSHGFRGMIEQTVENLRRR